MTTKPMRRSSASTPVPPARPADAPPSQPSPGSRRSGPGAGAADGSVTGEAQALQHGPGRPGDAPVRVVEAQAHNARLVEQEQDAERHHGEAGGDRGHVRAAAPSAPAGLL